MAKVSPSWSRLLTTNVMVYGFRCGKKAWEEARIVGSLKSSFSGDLLTSKSLVSDFNSFATSLL